MKTPNEIKTLEIDDFGGRLTRINNGKVNSGMAKFTTSFGYDPFSKPNQLTWLETPVDITGPIANLPLAAKTTPNSGLSNTTVFLYDAGSKFYGIRPNTTSSANVDSVVGIASIQATNGATLTYGASMEFYGNTLQVYVGTEFGVNKANFDGTGDTFVGTKARYLANSYRPLRQFIGKLYFGNGTTIGAIDNTGTVTSPVASVAGNSGLYSELTPPLPREMFTQDLDLSIDGNYLLLTASNSAPDRIDAILNDLPDAVTNDSGSFKWNGVDAAITALTNLPTYSVTALQTYLGQNLFFSNDAFGSSLSDESKKLLMFPNNKSPLPNAVCSNGNFITWFCAEVVGTTRYASLYYFGALDEDNKVGLFRVLRWATTQNTAQVFQAPLNLLINNNYQTLSSAYATITTGYGKHYLGLNSVNTSGTYQAFLLRFLITPTGTGTPQLGVYETQNQLFSKKISLSEIRVYCAPTATANGFQLDLIGSDGLVVTNGTFNYTFAAGTDITKLQGALDRINFNPNNINLYSLGVRITNRGTTNMTINKIEIDYTDGGR